jgi:hypothetical protein
MKLAQLYLLASFAVLGLSSVAPGQVVIDMHVDASVSGTAINLRAQPFAQTVSDVDGKNNTGGEPLDVAFDDSAVRGEDPNEAIATLHASAHAEISDLGVHIQGGGTAPNGGQAQASASAKARWRDNATLFTGFLPADTALVMHFHIDLNSDLSAIASGEGSASAQLTLRDLIHLLLCRHRPT